MQKQLIESFAQYGLVNYKDPSPLGNSFIIKMSYPLLALIKKINPKLTFKAKPPKYNGKNAKKEEQWYEELNKKGAMDMNIALLKTLLDIVLSKSSNVRKKAKCPVLVFAPKHDRYYSMDYIEKYYYWLDEPKEIYEIDDSHLSFLWHSEEICKKASEWFYKFS